MTFGGIKNSAVHADLSKHRELPVLISGKRSPGGQKLSDSAKNIQDGTAVIAWEVGMLHAQAVGIACIRYCGNRWMFQAKTVAVAYIVTGGQCSDFCNNSTQTAYFLKTDGICYSQSAEKSRADPYRVKIHFRESQQRGAGRDMAHAQR